MLSLTSNFRRHRAYSATEWNISTLPFLSSVRSRTLAIFFLFFLPLASSLSTALNNTRIVILLHLKILMSCGNRLEWKWKWIYILLNKRKGHAYWENISPRSWQSAACSIPKDHGQFNMIFITRLKKAFIDRSSVQQKGLRNWARILCIGWKKILKVLQINRFKRVCFYASQVYCFSFASHYNA